AFSLSTTPLAISPARASTGGFGACVKPAVASMSRNAANKVVFVFIVCAPDSGLCFLLLRLTLIRAGSFSRRIWLWRHKSLSLLARCVEQPLGFLRNGGKNIFADIEAELHRHHGQWLSVVPNQDYVQPVTAGSHQAASRESDRPND